MRNVVVSDGLPVIHLYFATCCLNRMAGELMIAFYLLIMICEKNGGQGLPC